MPDRPFGRGLVQVYTGAGKGKTTAALGLSIRAVGHGLRVFIAQFMKGVTYGELRTLLGIPNITIRQFGSSHWIIPGQIKEEDKQLAFAGFERACEAISSGQYDLAILDEINVALSFGLLPLGPILDLIATKPLQVELVLTGRNAPREVIDLADLVTEMVPIKHPFQKGVPARRGIEW
ncbi:MAG: cob(I)yrinic acid a,c-diamide adenosyltransferase [Chloroflexi bacterium]|nr:cob(I)yrinic acid a,c-diamide adenosyltransferase [Chloroflexota bacterium]